MTYNKGTDKEKNIKYEYNELNELIREDNQLIDKTIKYTYDVGGNITKKEEFPYTLGDTPTPTKIYDYKYEDTNWKDKLTSFDGKDITYDAIGNTLTYDNWNFIWERGRQLKSMTKEGTSLSFKYNDAGIRTEKTVNGVVTKYHLVGDKVTYEDNGVDKIYYTYDSSDNLVSMNLNGEEYYYIRNAQGDITELFDKSGAQVVSYVYDSWGKLVSIDGTLKDTIGVKNPYRYRGYRYDSETGLYYLQSRYYNPEWGRFINADAFAGQCGELLSHNMFIYSINNPVNMSDPGGFRPLFTADEETDEMREASFAAMQKAAHNNSSKVVTHASLGLEGKPNSVGRKYGKNGRLEQERYYGPDGRAMKDRDLTDHGNPKKHPKVPHEHDWDWSVDPPKRGPAYSVPMNNIGKGVVVAGGGYLIYRGVRMIPSFLPPLWWTIPANTVCP